MSNNNLEVSLVSTDDGFAYDIQLNSEDVTLWQYIENLDAFLDEKVAPCLGCDTCCYQRIPLTLPDLYGYAGFEIEAVKKFLEERVVISKQGPALDIRLLQGEEGRCTFLDNDEQRCSDHIHRSLVCHTYICLPQTNRARDLREYLINQGEDSLIAQLFYWELLPQYEDLRPSYPLKDGWQGKVYTEIRLKEILTPILWEALTKKL